MFFTYSLVGAAFGASAFALGAAGASAFGAGAAFGAAGVSAFGATGASAFGAAGAAGFTLLAFGAAGAASLRGGKLSSWIAPVGQTATHLRHIRHFV